MSTKMIHLRGTYSMTVWAASYRYRTPRFSLDYNAKLIRVMGVVSMQPVHRLGDGFSLSWLMDSSAQSPPEFLCHSVYPPVVSG